MREAIQKMTAKGIYPYLTGDQLVVAGDIDDEQRRYIKRHRDELKATFSVDVDKYLEALAIGLPVNHTWLMDRFFTLDDLTLISLGEYLDGDIDTYRQEIKHFLATAH